MIGEWLVTITVILFIITIGIGLVYFLLEVLKDSLEDGSYILASLISLLLLLLCGIILIGLGI